MNEKKYILPAYVYYYLNNNSIINTLDNDLISNLQLWLNLINSKISIKREIKYFSNKYNSFNLCNFIQYVWLAYFIKVKKTRLTSLKLITLSYLENPILNFQFNSRYLRALCWLLDYCFLDKEITLLNLQDISNLYALNIEDFLSYLIFNIYIHKVENCLYVKREVFKIWKESTPNDLLRIDYLKRRVG